MKLTLILVTLCYFAILIATIRIMYHNDLVKYVEFKMMASTGFLLVGLLSFLICKDKLYFGFLPGYILCFLGDFFLAIAKTKEGGLKPRKFIMGLASFLLAHVFFCINFIRLMDGHIGYVWVIFSLFGLVSPLVLGAKGRYDFKGKKSACIMYAVMVTTFVGMAFSYAQYFGFPSYAIYMFIGSLLFVTSDSILSFKYFGTEKKKWYILYELSTYYLAMYVLSTFILLK